jgi:hypothetical protein
MTASTFDVTRANSLKVPAKEKVEVMKPSKPLPKAAHGGDLPATVEHFQRGGFYS